MAYIFRKIGVGVRASALAATLPAFKNTEIYEGKKLNFALCGLGRYAGYLAEGLQNPNKEMKVLEVSHL